MKLKIKLTLIVIAMAAAAIAITAVITLSRSSALISNAAYDYAQTLAEREAIDITKTFQIYSLTATIVAQTFGEFYTLPAEMRRTVFDDNLDAIVTVNDSIMGMWTAWLPNSLDGRDAQLGTYNTYFMQDGIGGPTIRVSEGYPNHQNLLQMAVADSALLFFPNPEWKMIDGKEMLIMNLIYAVTDGQTKKQVGVVGINFTVDLQENVKKLSAELYEGAGVPAIYSNDGLTIAHDDETRVKGFMKDNPKEQDLLGNDLNNVLDSIKKGEVKELTKYSPSYKSDFYIIYNPINIMDCATPWTIMVGIPITSITAPVRTLTIFIVIFAAIAIIVAAVIAFLVASSVVKPVIGMANTLKDISQGEGDLTVVIDEKGKDETADMAHYFNLTIKKIKDLIKTIKDESAVLYDIGNELASNMTETASAINEITSNIQNIKGRVINQSASVSETNATMEQITDNIGKLNNHIDRQSQSVSQSSSAIEQMLANIQSVTNTLVKNAGNVKELMEASEVGKAGLQEVAEDIQEIARESEGLLEINSVMENIASQTNLLSMNAAIEAAHAGEAGKGFAVVASEIRKLAESSSQQSKTISTVLKKIKAAIDKITKSTDNVLKKFEGIDSGVKTVADQEENIRNAMEEQSQGSKQVLNAISAVSEVTQQVKLGSEEMLH